MYIKCWGARGSIPVSGKQYLKYGGDTTCIEVRSNNDEILIIDAGTGIRRLGNKLLKDKRWSCHMLFTHAHWDHLMGFPFFKPIFYTKTKLSIIRCPHPGEYTELMMKRVMSPPHFPILYKDIKAGIMYEDGCPDGFFMDTIEITPIKLSHPNSGSGYRLEEGDKSFVFLTDNELGFIHQYGHTLGEYAEFSKNADLLIHDCEYTDEDYQYKKEWGHSSISQVAEMARLAEVKKLGLFHHNQDRSDEEVDLIVEKVRGKLSDTDIEVFGVTSDMEFYL